MKNKRTLPIVGIVVGLIIGIFVEFKVWTNFDEWVLKGVPSIPRGPSGGPPFGPGMIAIMLSGLLGMIGILINEIYVSQKSRK